jgi:hypothetical protein
MRRVAKDLRAEQRTHGGLILILSNYIKISRLKLDLSTFLSAVIVQKETASSEGHMRASGINELFSVLEIPNPKITYFYSWLGDSNLQSSISGLETS